ncbi:hypothetical protein KDN32_01955 [Nocardioides sp. J2M5]|uniref:hypothetical protein n=1 Tax=Nocardioides palaemonis TaxID=2829810 RepID=UPI001BAD6E9F|nr:hypothetical protein [Nocardioides palaemonis]MBS2936502.1 hypothetical protein [Nocardioides palaemonis]
MTPPAEDDRSAPDAERPAPEPEWKRRRRLAAVFGESLPEQTSDDRGPSGSSGSGKGDDWYRDQVPPHHG